MSSLWQVGWIIGGIWYAVLQATIGFYAGYTVDFITIIVLYAIATALYWIWFRPVDRNGPRRATRRLTASGSAGGASAPRGSLCGRRPFEAGVGTVHAFSP